MTSALRRKVKQTQNERKLVRILPPMGRRKNNFKLRTSFKHCLLPRIGDARRGGSRQFPLTLPRARVSRPQWRENHLKCEHELRITPPVSPSSVYFNSPKCRNIDNKSFLPYITFSDVISLHIQLLLLLISNLGLTKALGIICTENTGDALA